MTESGSDDVVPLWTRPDAAMPERPVGGSHHWRFATVRAELERLADESPTDPPDRRVAMLVHPGLDGGASTDGLNSGIQMLRPGESAPEHRHTPTALRIGLVGDDVSTTVDGVECPLRPLDVVLNPSGTWHGHSDRADGGWWLDIVDLPIVRTMGGVLFESARSATPDHALDPPSIPDRVRYAWSDQARQLVDRRATDGVRTIRYGSPGPNSVHLVVPTLAISAHAIDAGASLTLPRRTGGAIVLAAAGRLRVDASPAADREVAPFDVIALRSWTTCRLTCTEPDPTVGAAVVMIVDTSPALAALGLYREEPES